jgi:hypothetical protein
VIRPKQKRRSGGSALERSAKQIGIKTADGQASDATIMLLAGHLSRKIREKSDLHLSADVWWTR